MGFLHEVREAGENNFEDAACFAGFDHVDEEVVEDFGVLREGFGEGGAAFDGAGELARDAPEDGIFLLGFKEAEAAEEREAGVDEAGELAGEGNEEFGVHARGEEAWEFEAGAGRRGNFWARLAGGGFDAGGEVAHFFEAADGFVLVGDEEFAFGLFAARVHRYVTELWHA